MTNKNVVVTTEDWLGGTTGWVSTSYDPDSWAALIQVESDAVEPGQAVNLSVVDRGRMGNARPGVNTVPERL